MAAERTDALWATASHCAEWGDGAGLVCSVWSGVPVRCVSGAVAAFGLARGLALAADALSGGQEWTPEVLAGAALLTGQSMLMFAFAALALETATARGALKRFGEAG
jgi:hypothetical protein